MTVAGPFAHTYRVRFDEAGADGFLRPSGYLRYAQDLAWLHSEAAGYDRAWYAERQSLWLVRSVALRLLRPVESGAHLDVSTEVVGWRRVLARRLTRFVDEHGALCADAAIDWALLGPGGRPMSVPKAISEAFAPGASFAPLRVVPGDPPTDAAVMTLDVRDADVDPMGHLNNAAYLDLVDAGLVGWELPASRTYRLEYLRPAVARDSLSIRAWTQDGSRWACRIAARDVELCRATVDRGGVAAEGGPPD
jgi:acyl-CoA thioesterase FadM